MDKPHYLYRHYGASNELLYIGIALYPVARTKWHRSLSPWFSDIRTITIQALPDKAAAVAAERAAIATEYPRFNIHHIPRPPRSQMTRSDAAALGNRAAADAARARTLAKLPAARGPWRDPDHYTAQQVAELSGLSVKTLYTELGRRPMKRKGKSRAKR